MAAIQTDSLVQDLSALTPSQQEWVHGVIMQFRLPFSYWRNPQSDFITEGVIERVGDALRIHHAFSRQPLTKDRFEFAFERALALCQVPAQLVTSRTNRGHDITINGVPVSLKTEAARNIQRDRIHISKWMELGRGAWELPLLRDLFLGHMHNYDRVFTMRCLDPGPANYSYELVEIPKALLLLAKDCELELREDSRQSPKPGYGYVRDAGGALLYSLYFDGGTERKLQIKGLLKSQCVVHATWRFESASLELESTALNEALLG
jgi:Type II site-specific deoxyribonuclease